MFGSFAGLRAKCFWSPKRGGVMNEKIIIELWIADQLAKEGIIKATEAHNIKSVVLANGTIHQETKEEAA